MASNLGERAPQALLHQGTGHGADRMPGRALEAGR